MPRYIDADELKSTLKNLPRWGGEVLLLSVLNTVDWQFTADVAPRAEVDKWKQLFYDAKKTIGENAQRSLEITLEEIENAKREVAKEIFDLIEDECLAYPIQEGHPTILVDARNYNELKKKYIGGDDHD